MKVKELINYEEKSKIKAGDAILNGKYPLFTSSEAEDKRYDQYTCDAEGIIMGTGGNATLHYYNGKFAVSTDCLVLKTNQNVKCKYLYYFFKANMKVLQDGFKGAGLKHTNKNYIENIELNMLPNINEQLVIIERLDRINNIIQKHKKVINYLDTLIKARFVEMFGDIDDVKKWERKKWQEVVEIRNGKDYKKVLVKKGGYPVYGTGGEMARASEYLCPENTIVVGRKGSINNPLLVKEKFWNVDTAFGVVVKKELNYQYLYQFCKSFNFMKLNKATTLPSTTKEDLLKIEINLPPIDLQNQFATFVKEVDKLKFE